MKTIFKFLKTTFMGGVLFLLPFVVTVLLLREALRYVAEILKPIVEVFPAESVIGIRTENLLAVFVLLVLGFLAGLVAKTGLGAKLSGQIEQLIFRHIPGYNLFKSIAQEGREFGSGSTVRVGLARDDKKRQLCFIIERHENGFVTIFTPNSPTPTSGELSLLPADQVEEIDVPVATAMKCIMHLGVGSGKLLGGTTLKDG